MSDDSIVLVKSGVRGRPGPAVSAAAFDNLGRLVITLDDGAVLTSNPIERPWGTLAGTITDQTDLMQLLGDKVDGSAYAAFVQQVDAALVARYTKTEADARFDPVDAASDAVVAHEASLDPHPQYATTSEAAAAAPVQSVQGRAGAVVVTKADLAIENVDNTSDTNKPVSTAQQGALDLKVDKATGKQLSDENYTTTEKNKLSGIATAATANATDAALRDRASHTGAQAATTVTVADAGNYFAGTNAETVLQEVGALLGDTAAALDAINGVVI